MVEGEVGDTRKETIKGFARHDGEAGFEWLVRTFICQELFQVGLEGTEMEVGRTDRRHEELGHKQESDSQSEGQQSYEVCCIDQLLCRPERQHIHLPEVLNPEALRSNCG